MWVCLGEQNHYGKENEQETVIMVKVHGNLGHNVIWKPTALPAYKLTILKKRLNKNVLYKEKAPFSN